MRGACREGVNKKREDGSTEEGCGGRMEEKKAVDRMESDVNGNDG